MEIEQARSEIDERIVNTKAAGRAATPPELLALVERLRLFDGLLYDLGEIECAEHAFLIRENLARVDTWIQAAAIYDGLRIADQQALREHARGRCKARCEILKDQPGEL
ncbi:TPA: hypothetical protein ACUUEN_005522 [Pseudomonas aeruginosa]